MFVYTREPDYTLNRRDGIIKLKAAAPDENQFKLPFTFGFN